MKTTLYVAGVEGPGSGSWDWFRQKEQAETQFSKLTEEFADLPDEIVYKGEITLEAAEGIGDEEITELVELWLIENGYNDAFKN